MSARPWYKRYPADFIAGTLAMTLEQKGAYSIVLDLMYDRGGPIPDDPQWIARACGCSVRKWNTIRKYLIEAGKIHAENGTLTNFRAEQQAENGAKTARKLSESGAKGGNKTAENKAMFNEISILEQKRLCEKSKHTRNQILETREEKEKINQKETEGFQEEFREHFWPPWPHKIDEENAQTAYIVARRTGARREDIVAGIQPYISNKPGWQDFMGPAKWLRGARWKDKHGDTSDPNIQLRKDQIVEELQARWAAEANERHDRATQRNG